MNPPAEASQEEQVVYIVIRPDARLWSFRLSGGMSTSTFIRRLAPPETREPN